MKIPSPVLRRSRSVLVLYFIVSVLSILVEKPASGIGYSMADGRGMGARAIGMGGAFTAVADDPSANYYNPAGLIQIDSNLLQFEYVSFSPRITLQRGTGPGEIYIYKRINSPMFALVLDLSKHWKTSRRVRLALSGYVPSDFKRAGSIRYGTVYDPWYVRYGDNSVEHSTGAYINIAFEIFSWLYFGGGFAWGATGHDIHLKMTIDGNVASGDLSNVRLVNERNTLTWKFSHEIAGMFGILVKPLDDLTLGFAMRKELKLFFDGDIVGSGYLYLGPDLPPFPLDPLMPGFPLHIPVNAHYKPLQYAFGISYRAFGKLLLAFDLTYLDYQPYKDEKGTAYPNPRLKGILVPKFGVEFLPLKDVALRAGYGYKPSPVRQQQGTWVNYMDNEVHEISCGAGYTFSSLKYPLTLSAFYQYSYLVPRTLQNVHAGEPPLHSSGHMDCYGGGLSLAF